MTPVAFKKPDTRNKLMSIRYSVWDLLRRPHLTVEEVDDIAGELNALAERARRRKGEVDPTERL